MERLNKVLAVIAALLIATLVAALIYQAANPPVPETELVEIDDYPVAIY